jgi:quercetin dioxygenase-like cupin family protein
LVRAAGEGERRWFAGGGVHTWKVRSEESGGAFALFEDTMTRGKTTPWHAHPRSDELIYVLDGELLVRIGGDEQKVGAGGMYFTPRGVPHAFVVVSDEAHVLGMVTPGGAESFYVDASEPWSGADGEVDFERIAAVAAATGVTKVLGPSPFASAG